MIETIIAGDTLEITYENSEYSSSTYDIKISLRSLGLDPIDIMDGSTGVTIVKSDGLFTITVAASTTSGWDAGIYRYAIFITTATERYQVETGQVEIKADLTALTSTSDVRSHVKKVLDAIEAVIEGRANVDQQSYSIAGRTLSRTPIADLLVLRDRYRWEYQREQQAEKVAAGYKPGGQVRVRF